MATLQQDITGIRSVVGLGSLAATATIGKPALRVTANLGNAKTRTLAQGLSVRKLTKGAGTSAPEAGASLASRNHGKRGRASSSKIQQPAQRQFSIIKCSSSTRLSIFFKSLRRPFSGLMSRVRHRMIMSRRSRILLAGTWEPLF